MRCVEVPTVVGSSGWALLAVVKRTGWVGCLLMCFGLSFCYIWESWVCENIMMFMAPLALAAPLALPPLGNITQHARHL